MKYDYEPPSIESKYENQKWLTKKYGKDIAVAYAKFTNFVKSADSAYDLKAAIWYYLEHDKHNMNAYYSLSLDKKKSKWRVIIQMIDENDEVKIPGPDEKAFLKSIKKIRIRRFSEHYGEY